MTSQRSFPAVSNFFGGVERGHLWFRVVPGKLKKSSRHGVCDLGSSNQLTPPPWTQGVVQEVGMWHQPGQGELILRHLQQTHFLSWFKWGNVSRRSTCHHDITRRLIFRVQPALQKTKKLGPWRSAYVGSSSLSRNEAYLWVFWLQEPIYSLEFLSHFELDFLLLANKVF